MGHGDQRRGPRPIRQAPAAAPRPCSVTTQSARNRGVVTAAPAASCGTIRDTAPSRPVDGSAMIDTPPAAARGAQHEVELAADAGHLPRPQALRRDLPVRSISSAELIDDEAVEAR